MGTNYYYHINICQHCNRSDVFHVGKKSMGWSFHFRAHRDNIDGIPKILTSADWSRMFKTTAGILVDESEAVIDNPLEFLAKLDRPTPEQQAWEDSPDQRGGYSLDPNREWRDIDGFYFYDGEFS